MLIAYPRFDSLVAALINETQNYVSSMSMARWVASAPPITLSLGPSLNDSASYAKQWLWRFSPEDLRSAYKCSEVRHGAAARLPPELRHLGLSCGKQPSFEQSLPPLRRCES